MLLELLKKAFIKRKELINLSDDSVFRLFAGKNDGFHGLVIDMYGEFLLIQYFCEEDIVPKMQSLIKDYVDFLKNNRLTVLGTYLKNREKASDAEKISDMRISTLIYGENHPPEYTVTHNNCRFYVDLINSQHTGLFADMRSVREKIIEFYPSGGTMLNLFSYTGAFSIHALLHGVKTSINVDLSKSTLTRAKNNYTLNDILFDDRDFLKMDAFDAIKYFIKKKQSFDYIVFDPPSFARNKKNYFKVEEHFSGFLDNLYLLLKTGGFLLAVVNTYSISVEKYNSMFSKKWKPVFLESESDDFHATEEHYLKAGLWMKK